MDGGGRSGGDRDPPGSRLRTHDKRLSQFQWRPSDAGARSPSPLACATATGSARWPVPRRSPPASTSTGRPSRHRRLTVEKYERLQTLPHYRTEDDLVVEAPDGSLAAFAMAWWDPEGRVGEFEPVGTHPDHQRRGLSRALLTWGLQRYAERGARVVQVYSDAYERGLGGALRVGRVRAARLPPALRPPGRRRRRTYNRRHDQARPGTRIERDSMGEMAVPADALYGASTQRAVLNFPISGQPFPRGFIRALALIKLAAAETNGELGLLEPDVARAIAAAAASVADGDHDAQFPIDIYQTGSGTSTNTNMNEVVAHLAARRLGAGRRGPPERRRQSMPELERRDPDGPPARGGDGDRGGAAARRSSSCRRRSPPRPTSSGPW